MPFESQPVVGAAQFDGTAGSGLFTFAEITGFAGDAFRPTLLSLFVTCDGVAPRIQIFRALPGTPAAERQILADETGNSVGISCRTIIPKDANNAPMNIFIVSTGKTADGRAELDWVISNVL
jgi:hypothetical protein